MTQESNIIQFPREEIPMEEIHEGVKAVLKAAKYVGSRYKLSTRSEWRIIKRSINHYLPKHLAPIGVELAKELRRQERKELRK